MAAGKSAKTPKAPAGAKAVETALLENATGCKYTEQVMATRKETVFEDGKRVKEVVEPFALSLEKWQPGELKAQMYWLEKRQPEAWGAEGEAQEDPLAAVRELTESNREVARHAIQQETG